MPDTRKSSSRKQSSPKPPTTESARTVTGTSSSELPNVKSLSDTQLRQLFYEINAEILQRQTSDTLTKTVALATWTQLVLDALQLNKAATHFLASKSAAFQSKFKRAATTAEEFIWSVGDWTVDDATTLRKVCVRVLIAYMCKIAAEVNVTTVLLGLGEIEPAFRNQFPGYIENSMLPFLLQHNASL